MISDAVWALLLGAAMALASTLLAQWNKLGRSPCADGGALEAACAPQVLSW
jgi:hypothetical protein